MTQPSPDRQWSVVIPYYNEEAYIGDTLQSIAAQTCVKGGERLQLILVDNASTDASPEITSAFKKDHPEIDVRLLREEKPGQAAALETGIRAATGAFTAICDADTIYPPQYLETASALFSRGGDRMVGVIAFGVAAPKGFKTRLTLMKSAFVGWLLAKQCHGGGYAHAFRTDILKKAGGYSQKLWPYCLKDHELVNRIVKHGTIGYSGDHWCIASDRRSSRSNVRWTLPERLLYHATPHRFKDWFFYDFLKSRFDKRGLSELNLRQREWEQP